MVGRDWLLAAVVVALLGTATTVGQIVQRQPHLGLNAAAISTFNRRVRSWWIICALLAVAFFSPKLTVALIVLFSVVMALFVWDWIDWWRAFTRRQ